MIKKDQGHLRSAYGVLSQFLDEILENAGIKNPDDWWSHFVKGMTFLGQPINLPIREHLANHLRTVEAELAEKFGGPNKDKLQHATGKWKKLDAAAARKLIEKDVVRFAGKLARAKRVEMIRKGGFPELKEALPRGSSSTGAPGTATSCTSTCAPTETSGRRSPTRSAYT